MTDTTTPRADSAQSAPVDHTSTAPGWPEMIAGAAGFLVSMALVYTLLPLIQDEAVSGVIGFFASALTGMFAFAVAYLIRIRDLRAFGFRAARPRHLLAGLGLGVAAYIVGTVLSLAYVVISGDVQVTQASYQAGAAAGAFSFVLTILAGSVLTPLGEEAFFRGVIANALLSRYTPWIAVLASAAVFALAHGLNAVLPTAFTVGVLSALLFRRSGSIWPSAVLHGTNNIVATLVPLLVSAATPAT